MHSSSRVWRLVKLEAERQDDLVQLKRHVGRAFGTSRHGVVFHDGLGLSHLLQRHPPHDSDHSKEGWARTQGRKMIQRHVQPASTSSTTSWGTQLSLKSACRISSDAIRCLYHWFKTSSKTTCPLCNQPWGHSSVWLAVHRRYDRF